MRDTHYISSEVLTLNTIHTILFENKMLALSDEAKLNIEKARQYLDAKIEESNTPVYGINTGFGSLCNVSISNDKLSELQENLVKSHACGTGDLVQKDIIRLMLLLKIQSLSYGNSGVQLDTVLRLIDFFNEDILPVIFEQGSLGASGDLAPLAHLALPLLGLGEVWQDDKRVKAATVLETNNWEPIVLQSKEGLALLNGTQFMSAHGVYVLLQSYKMSYLADVISALSMDAFNCNLSPFDELVHFVRPHRGQIKTADRIREILEGSEIAEDEKPGIILLGKQAIDDDCNQTAQMVSALLNWSQGTFASKIEIENDSAVITREIDEGLEKIKVKIPFVASCDLRLNEPRYASLPNIMKAKKKPIDIKTAVDLGVDISPRIDQIKVEEAPVRQKGVIVSDVAELVQKLKHEAKVI